MSSDNSRRDNMVHSETRRSFIANNISHVYR